MEMDTTTIVTLVATVAAAIGGKEAWSYYKKRLDIKAKLALQGNSGETDLRNEIKDMLSKQIAELKEQVKLLTGRIKSLEEEREIDKKRIANQEMKISVLSERLGAKLSSTGKKGKNQNQNPLDDIPTID